MAARGGAIPSAGDHVPPDKDQRVVATPFGEALVVRTSLRRFEGGGAADGAPAAATTVVYYEMELTGWPRAEGSHAKPATLYSPVDYPSVPPTIGDDVLARPFGRGRVVAIGADGRLAVRLSQWRLARRGRATCHLPPGQVRVVRRKQLYEMTVPEKVERGQELKGEAAALFAARDYEGALQAYAKAVDAVRYVQHTPDSTNELRADLLLLMVTCSNNAATCSLQTQRHDNAINFAGNALTLIEALEGKKGMKIHAILNADGLSDTTLFGEYKVKSLLVAAKAHLEKNNTDEALQHLKRAHSVAHQYSVDGASSKALHVYEKEISKLYTTCKEKRQVEKIKEMKRAKAMFASAEEKAPQSEDAGPGPVSAAPAAEPELTVSFAPEPARDSASPTSVVDDEETPLTPNSGPKKLKKKVSFSSNVKMSKEDQEDAFYVGLGLAAVVVVTGIAIGCTAMLRAKSKG